MIVYGEREWVEISASFGILSDTRLQTQKYVANSAVNTAISKLATSLILLLFNYPCTQPHPVEASDFSPFQNA